MLRRFNNNESKTIGKNFFYLALVQGSNFILPILAIPYLVRTLGDDQYGLVLFAQSVALYLVLFTDYGIEAYGTKLIAAERDHPEKIRSIFWNLSTIKGLLFLVGLGLLSIAVIHPKLWPLKEAIFLSLGIVVANLLFPIWYYLGIEKMKYISLLNISAKVFFTLLIFVFVKTTNDVNTVLILHSGGYLVAGIISLFILRKFDLRWVKPKRVLMLNHLKEGSWFFLSRLAFNLYTFSNVFVLGMFSPTNAVGSAVANFGIGEKLFRAMQGMFDPIVKALYPNMVRNKKGHVFKPFFLLFFGGNTLLCIVTFLLSPYIIQIIYVASPDPDSLNIFRILLLAQFITVPNMLLGYPFLGAYGHEKTVNISSILAAAIHITAISIMVATGTFNMYTLSYQLIITELCGLLIKVIAIKRHNLWKLA